MPEAAVEDQVEIVAKAIYDATHAGLSNCYDWNDLWEDHQEARRDRYYKEARAALAATNAGQVEAAWSEFRYGAPVEVTRKRDTSPEFPSFVIGWYGRLDGARGYVLEHDPHRIVHVNPIGSVISRAALKANGDAS